MKFFLYVFLFSVCSVLFCGCNLKQNTGPDAVVQPVQPTQPQTVIVERPRPNIVVTVPSPSVVVRPVPPVIVVPSYPHHHLPNPKSGVHVNVSPGGVSVGVHK